jgi:hypothetical protein
VARHSYTQHNGAVTLYHDNSPKLATTSGGINVTGAIQLNGTNFATESSNGAYHELRDPTGRTAIFLGGSDTGNYYDNDNHYLRTRASSNLVQVNTNGLYLHTGTYRVGTTTVIDSNRNLTNILAGSFSGTVSINQGSSFSKLQIGTGRTGATENIGAVEFLNSSSVLKAQVYGSNDGQLRLTTNGNTLAVRLDSSQNAHFEGDISLPDVKKIKLGTGNDLLLYHDSESVIEDAGTNGLDIRTNGPAVSISGASDLMAKFIKDGAVELYHDNVKRLQTTSSGVEMINGLVVQGATSFNDDANFGAALQLNGTTVTSTAAELNKLDGFTGTVADLNYAKDLRATGVTATEFDYLDGVTSNIQTQIDAVQTVTINNNADNRLITGSGTAQTLNGEANLLFGATPNELEIRGQVGTLGYVPTIVLTDTDHTNTFAEINQGDGRLNLIARNNTTNGSFVFAGKNGTTTTTYGGFDASGNFEIGTTDVIQAGTRNLVNIGTISTSGNITAGNDINISGNELTFTNDSASAYIRGADALLIQSDYNTGENKPIYLQPSATTEVTVATGQTTFAGTISSGAITSTGSSTFADTLTVSGAVQGGIRLISANTQTSFVDFGDAQDNNVGLIAYSHSNNEMFFRTNATEALRFDSSQNATFAGDIDLADAKKIKLGNSDDLQIYHTGSHSYIYDTGTGNLVLKGQEVVIQSGNSTESKAIFRDDGAAELYFNDSLKIATTSGGVDITGEILATSTITSNGKLVSTADGSEGGHLLLRANSGGAKQYSWDVDSSNNLRLIGEDDGTGNNGFIIMKSGNGGQDVDLQKDLKMVGTLVMNQARNMSNIGTISSGAITSSGLVTADELSVTNDSTFNGGIDATGQTITSGAITSSGTLKSTNATGLILDTGAAYRDVQFVLTGNTGNGTLEIIPMTVPGSGTAIYTTHFKNLSATGTTRHDLKVDGDIRANGGDYFTNSGAAGNYRGFGDRLGLSIVNGASYIYDAASTPVIALAAYTGNVHIYNELKMGNLSGTTY